MSGLWGIVAVAVVLAVVVAAVLWWPEKREHGRGCGCHGCYEANLREAYRQHQEEERHRRGELR